MLAGKTRLSGMTVVMFAIDPHGQLAGSHILLLQHSPLNNLIQTISACDTPFAFSAAAQLCCAAMGSLLVQWLRGSSHNP